MSSVYKVTEIKGKGLGCIAIVDIKKGSLILDENPQICFDIKEELLSSGWIKSLLKSFHEMSKADQDEYMTLHNKFNNFQDYQNSEDFQNCKEIVDRPVASGGARGAHAPPLFDRSTKPISTRVGTLSPPSTVCPTGFSDLAMALVCIWSQIYNQIKNSWNFKTRSGVFNALNTILIFRLICFHFSALSWT